MDLRRITTLGLGAISILFSVACSPGGGGKESKPTEQKPTEEGGSVDPKHLNKYKYSRRGGGCINILGQKGLNSDGTFECAVFKDQDWSGRDFRNVSFKGSTLTDIDFSSANLEGASFIGADLSGSSFFKANLVGAVFAEYTELPQDFKKKDLLKRGAQFVDLGMKDWAFSREVSESNFTEADKLLALGAEIPAYVSHNYFKKAHESGSMKAVLQYWIKAGIDYFDEEPVTSLLQTFLDSIGSTNISILVEAPDEIRTLLQKRLDRGYTPEKIWSSGKNLIENNLGDTNRLNLVLDIFLSIKGITINTSFPNDDGKSCNSILGLGSLRDWHPESIRLIFARGYDLSKNSCYENDLKTIVSFSKQKSELKSSVPTIDALRSRGFDFKKIFDGRSPALEVLVRQYLNRWNDNPNFGMVGDLIRYLDLNSASHINAVPATKDTILQELVSCFLTKNCFDRSKEFIKLIDARNLQNSQGKNLLQMTYLDDGKIVVGHIGEVITFLVEQGFSVKSGGESLFLRALETSNRYYDQTNQLLTSVIEAYKNTNTELDTIYNNENIIFYTKDHYLTNKMSVLKILKKSGFDLGLKNSKGQSLYWKHRHKDELLQLIDLGVPLDLFEEDGAKVRNLFSWLADNGEGYDSKEKFLQFLIEKKLIDFQRPRDIEALKKEVIKSYSLIHTLIFEKLRESNFVPKYRFARCPLNKGSDIFIEDPQGDLLTTMNAWKAKEENEPRKLRKHFSLILVKNGHEPMVNELTEIQPDGNQFGLQMDVNYGAFEGHQETYMLSSKDLQTITLNGQACVGLNEYPQDIAKKFRHVYYETYDKIFFINLKAIEEFGVGKITDFGIGLHPLGDLKRLGNWEDQFWPSKNPINDHYLIFISNAIYRSGANILFPKAALEKPVVGNQYQLQYHVHRTRWPEDIRSQNFKVLGVSY